MCALIIRNTCFSPHESLILILEANNLTWGRVSIFEHNVILSCLGNLTNNAAFHWCDYCTQADLFGIFSNKAAVKFAHTSVAQTIIPTVTW
jgi:hypothetical protein